MPEETVVVPLIRPGNRNHQRTLFAGRIRNEKSGCLLSGRIFGENPETMLNRILRQKKARKRPKEKEKYV